MASLAKIQSDWVMDPTNRHCNINCLLAMTELLKEQKKFAQKQLLSINKALELIKVMKKLKKK
jgi:hypothetical protein